MKLKLRYLLLIGPMTVFMTTSAQNRVKISGSNPTYKNQEIKICGYTDPITRNFIDLASDTVDSSGNFLFEFPLAETQLITVPLGIYQAILYLEPGKQYEVVLPDYSPKTQADILNPFFVPIEIYLGVLNPDTLDINILIAGFNQKYYDFIDANSTRLMRNARESFIDSLIQTLEAAYKETTHPYFNNFRKYQYARLKYGSVMRDSRYLIREYFRNQSILYTNNAYTDLFNQVFTNYLSFYAKSKEGLRLYSDIAFAKSPTYIYQTFANNMALTSDSLQEFALLKGLHDAFYSGDFPTQSLLVTLDSIACCPKVEKHAYIANQIRNKVLQARVGFSAPAFELYDAKGTLRKLLEFKSNYVYLNFISVASFPSQQDLELLKLLYDKHKNDFRIISISVDENIQEVQNYFDAHGFEWPVLSYKNQSSIITDYKVRAYPAYYLIDPEGKLVMSPANSPSENFEWQFFKMMQAKLRSPNH